jgi:hypothetical protein
MEVNGKCHCGYSIIFLALLTTSCSTVSQKGDIASDVSHPTSRPGAVDLQIIRRADAILSDEGKWNRQDTRECNTTDQIWSLYCALYQASLDVTGEFQHRRAGLEEVRKTVEELTQGTTFEHRMMNFNNLSSTSFTDIKKVLQITAQRLAAGIGNY